MSDLTDQRWIVVTDDLGYENIHFAPDADEADKGLLGDIVAGTYQDAETAQLIAAAPDMLEALQGLHAIYGPAPKDDVLLPPIARLEARRAAVDAAWDKAVAAIAKALGQDGESAS